MFLEALPRARDFAKDFTETCPLAQQQSYASVLLLSQVTDEETQAY